MGFLKRKLTKQFGFEQLQIESRYMTKHDQIQLPLELHAYDNSAVGLIFTKMVQDKKYKPILKVQGAPFKNINGKEK